MVCYPHTVDKWMHFKRGFVYTIKEAETSIGNNEVIRDMIHYIFFKETQRICVFVERQTHDNLICGVKKSTKYSFWLQKGIKI